MRAASRSRRRSRTLWRLTEPRKLGLLNTASSSLASAIWHCACACAVAPPQTRAAEMMIAADFMLSFLLKAIATGLSALIMRHSGLLKATKQIDLRQLSYRRKKIRWKRCELVRAWIRAGSTRLCNTDGQHPPASVQATRPPSELLVMRQLAGGKRTWHA